MATFAVTTPINIDTLVGRTGGDTLNLNGGSVVVDEDSRYGLNANTSATIGTVTPSPTLGGSILFDGRDIWLIPFTGGGGTVPAWNTLITRGAASGKLIGVHANLGSAPLAPGAAMPATGWIRVKQWNRSVYGTGALTGITATAAAGEKVGFIIPVAQEGSLCLISSLNQTLGDGSFCKGDWYEVGTTSGARATTYQVPSNGELVYHGAVMVDKAVATAITAATWSAGVLTVTSPAHGLSDDDRVMIDAILPRTFRTVDTQRITVLTANTFVLPMAVNPGAYVSGGTVAAQEWYPITESTNLKVGPEDYRGKFAWLDAATGNLTFGNDGVTSTGGYCPPAGLVVRMPNVMTAIATVATKTANNLAPVLATRWRYYNGNAGVIKVDHISGSWGASIFQTGKSVRMADSTVCNMIGCASQASPSSFLNVAVGGNASMTGTACFTVSGMSAGVTMQDCCISAGEMGSKYPLNISTVYGLTADRCRFTGTGDRTVASYGVNCNIGAGAVFTDCAWGPHPMALSSQFSDMSILDSTYYSSAYGLPQITFPAATISLTNLSTDWTIDTIVPKGANALAGRNSLLTTASGSDRVTLRNVGSYASPIDMRINGTFYGASWSRVTTVCTVTEVGHPYRVGDVVFVFNSSNSSGVTNAAKTITAVTANDFSFTCLNTGTTSGTLSYYGSLLSSILSMATTNGAKVQNVHVRGHFAQPTTTAATSTGFVMENVSSEPDLYNFLPMIGANNMQARSIYGSDYPIISQQSSIFGTHFLDTFQRAPGAAVPGQVAAAAGVTWNRVTTLCTVTSPGHGLTGGNQRIWVENSSNPAAIANGWGVSAITLNIIDANTFSFACLNTGATTGTLDYWLMGDSQFKVLMSEESPATVGQATITANSGAAGFTGAGSLVLPAVGDQATWETPTFLLGYDGFGRPPAIPYGNALSIATSWLNLNIEYALDRGAGYGPWRNAMYPRVGAGGVAATPTVTMTSTTGVQVGDFVSGAGIGVGAQVLSIDSPTQVTVSVNNAGTVSGILTFWYMPNEAAFPATGVRLKVRMTANTANTSAAYEIGIALVSSNTSRARLYDQRAQYTLTFTGLQPGSDIRIVEAGTVTSLLDADAVAGSSYPYTYFYAPGTVVDVQVLKDGFKPFRYQGYTLGADDAEFLVQQAVAIDEGS